MSPVGAMNYDQAADQYAAHRQIHPAVFCELFRRLASARDGRGGPELEATVLEVGCGTGNYVSALKGRLPCTAYGLDPSQGMLAHARLHPEGVNWVQGQAEQLCFVDGSFDLIFSVDVIHHITDKLAFFGQAACALHPGGQVCTITDSEEIIRRREILSGFFPETVVCELARYPRLAQLQAWMAAAELSGFKVVTVETPYQLTSAQPFREKAYSALHLIPEAAWRAGVERLEQALKHGPIQGVARYAMVWGSKPAQIRCGSRR